MPDGLLHLDRRQIDAPNGLRGQACASADPTQHIVRITRRHDSARASPRHFGACAGADAQRSLNLNFWPAIAASYIRPPLTMVKTAMPRL